MANTNRARDRDNEDRGPSLVVVASVMMALCTAALISRGLARRKTKMNLGADDFLVFLAYVRTLEIRDEHSVIYFNVSLQCLLVGLAVEYFLCA